MLLKSVTSRLVLYYCLLLVVLGAGFLAFTVWSFEDFSEQTFAANVVARSQEIWDVSQPVLDNPAALTALIERHFSPERLDRFIRISAGQRQLYRSGNPSDAAFDAAAVPRLASGGPPQAVLHGQLLLYSKTYSGPSGSITIESGRSFRFGQARLLRSLAIGLPVLLLLAALAGYVLMRQALTAVEAMINAAEAYTFNDHNNRLPTIASEPRIHALGQALNRMLDRLDSAYTYASRFSADAAHELRTPLSIIRGELELVLSHAQDPKEVERAIGNALEEMIRLTRIIDGLIALSRLESLWGKRYHAIVDVSALAGETVEQMSLLAAEKQIGLEKNLDFPVLVAGDRDRLKQLLVNLIDNAIKYGVAGGRVRITAGTSDDNAVITVEDDGIGIPAEHSERIFERFYRLSSTGGEGAGLGLAIVRSICHAHGGDVTVISTSGSGSIFRVTLPLLPAGFTLAAREGDKPAAQALSYLH